MNGVTRTIEKRGNGRREQGLDVNSRVALSRQAIRSREVSRVFSKAAHAGTGARARLLGWIPESAAKRRIHGVPSPHTLAIIGFNSRIRGRRARKCRH